MMVPSDLMATPRNCSGMRKGSRNMFELNPNDRARLWEFVLRWKIAWMQADTLHDEWLINSGPKNHAVQKKKYNEWMTASRVAAETYRDIEKFVVRLIVSPTIQRKVKLEKSKEETKHEKAQEEVSPNLAD